MIPIAGIVSTTVVGALLQARDELARTGLITHHNETRQRMVSARIG
jgi:hypothetical protein